MTEPPQRYTPRADLVARRLGDEMVVVHLGSSRIFELNATATRLWELLVEGHDLDAARRRLGAEFAVDDATLAAEIARTVAELTREGLLVPAPSA